MKKVSILGSTGSIGTQALQIAEAYPDKLHVVALAARTNIDLLERQARKFFPEIIAVFDEGKARELQKRLPKMRIVAGMEGLNACASLSGVDQVVIAMDTAVALEPTLRALYEGKQVALGTKEVLIAGGECVMEVARKRGIEILPIDSEQSALFQCLHGEKRESVRRLILTASGGPFYHRKIEDLENVTVDQALAHPTWDMGAKVTIDSSTLMNKGLEVIEAHHLFNIPLEQIDVVIQPQSIIHSMVEYTDGSIIMQASECDMRLPIQYMMTYPERLPGPLAPFDFTKARTLELIPADREKFLCLKLAYEAMKEGGSLPCYMNGVNEVLVERFLKKELTWIDIGRKLEKLMERHTVVRDLNIEKIFSVDKLAREEAAFV